jgi:serine/threonine protein kinase
MTISRTELNLASFEQWDNNTKVLLASLVKQTPHGIVLAGRTYTIDHPTEPGVKCKVKVDHDIYREKGVPTDKDVLRYHVVKPKQEPQADIAYTLDVDQNTLAIVKQAHETSTKLDINAYEGQPILIDPNHLKPGEEQILIALFESKLYQDLASFHKYNTFCRYPHVETATNTYCVKLTNRILRDKHASIHAKKHKTLHYHVLANDVKCGFLFAYIDDKTPDLWTPETMKVGYILIKEPGNKRTLSYYDGKTSEILTMSASDIDELLSKLSLNDDNYHYLPTLQNKVQKFIEEKTHHYHVGCLGRGSQGKVKLVTRTVHTQEKSGKPANKRLITSKKLDHLKLHAAKVASSQSEDETPALQMAKHMQAKDAIVDEDQRFNVMRILPGENLRSFIEKILCGEIILTKDQVYQVIDKIFIAAKQQIADLNLIHRDIKPENIFIDYSVDIATKKVTRLGEINMLDYGFAIPVNQPQVRTKGTPIYLAPEIWNGEAATESSDMYALGICISEILGAKNPESLVNCKLIMRPVFQVMLNSHHQPFVDLGTCHPYFSSNELADIKKLLQIIDHDQPNNRLKYDAARLRFNFTNIKYQLLEQLKMDTDNHKATIDNEFKEPYDAEIKLLLDNITKKSTIFRPDDEKERQTFELIKTKYQLIVRLKNDADKEIIHHEVKEKYHAEIKKWLDDIVKKPADSLPNDDEERKTFGRIKAKYQLIEKLCRYKEGRRQLQNQSISAAKTWSGMFYDRTQYTSFCGSLAGHNADLKIATADNAILYLTGNQQMVFNKNQRSALLQGELGKIVQEDNNEFLSELIKYK